MVDDASRKLFAISNGDNYREEMEEMAVCGTNRVA